MSKPVYKLMDHREGVDSQGVSGGSRHGVWWHSCPESV